jgi:deoxyribodipyrimidine photolyase
MTVISPDTFRDWKNHIVTQELYKKLQEDRQNLFEAWEKGDTLHDPLLNAQLISMAQTIKALLEFNPVNEPSEEAVNVD